MKFLILFLLTLSITPAFAFWDFDVSLKDQIAQGQETNDILCSNSHHMLFQRDTGNLACVKITTGEKLGWLQVYDDEKKQNLQSHKSWIVTQCGNYDAAPDVEIINRTHTFDNQSCTWFEFETPK
jgi:hypothetical protein